MTTETMRFHCLHKFLDNGVASENEFELDEDGLKHWLMTHWTLMTFNDIKRELEKYPCVCVQLLGVPDLVFFKRMS